MKRTKDSISKAWRVVAARPICAGLNRMLLECALRGLGVLNHENNKVSGEAHFIDQILPLYIGTESPVFVDAGANIGDYSLRLKEAWPDSEIHAFEPNPANCDTLRRRAPSEGIFIHQTAVGSRSGLGFLHDRIDSGGASSHGTLIPEVIEQIHGVKSSTIETSVTTLDEALQCLESKPISLLKLDIEGNEFDALKGASAWLASGRVHLIQIEFNEMNVVSRVFMRDFCRLLKDYTGFRLLPSGVLKLATRPIHSEIFGFQNIVFAHNRFEPDRKMRPSSPRLQLAGSFQPKSL